MVRHVRLLVVAASIAIGTAGCAPTTPTSPPATTPATSSTPAAASLAPASPTPAARPSIAGPAWVQNAAARWDPGSPQWNALTHPDVPYRLGGAAFGNPNGITFTPNLARAWWDTWFANPVDQTSIPPGLQPGGLVLGADEVKRVAQLQAGPLPPAPADYNPLGLPVVP